MTRKLIIINAGSSPTFPSDASVITCTNGVITALGNRHKAAPGDSLLDARGGAVIAGLRDHHIHLLATAAARASIDCATLGRQSLPRTIARRCAEIGGNEVGGPETGDLETEDQKTEDLENEDAGTKGSNNRQNGLRVVNYHESMHGPLNRYTLDQWAPNTPLRIQHATGKVWFLNSMALEQLNLLERAHPAIERDADGQPTGAVYRGDDLLRAARIGDVQAPDLSGLSKALASYGVTGVTDTSYHNTNAERDLLANKQTRGELLQQVRVMGSDTLTPLSSPTLHTGELKLLLDEASLPDLDALEQQIRAAHAIGRSVAVHCVTAIELAVVLGAFNAAGVLNDRIEHASVIPGANLSQIAESGLTVVTQPGLIHNRGDRYLRDLSTSECAQLYRLQSLAASGIPLALSSDAPYGPLSPWLNMSSAVTRLTATGARVSATEGLTPEQALLSYSGSLEHPTVPERINVGSVADLAILDAPWSHARHTLDQVVVQTTVRAGGVIYQRSPRPQSADRDRA